MGQTVQHKKDRNQRIINLALTVLVGQVGCLTLVIVIAAVFLGLWLDSRFQSKPTITIIAVLVSIPVSLVAMFFVARSTISRIKTEEGQARPIQEEGSDIGKDT